MLVQISGEPKANPVPVHIYSHAVMGGGLDL